MWEIHGMARTSLMEAMFHLAELRTRRDRLTIEVEIRRVRAVGLGVPRVGRPTKCAG
jgi:hypothetical protein